MIEGDEKAFEEYANWTASAEVEPESEQEKEAGRAESLVHRYFYNNQTKLLDDVAPEQRIQVIAQMLELFDGPTTVLDCCVKYIKDPAEQTILADLLFQSGMLSAAISNKELENVEPEIVPALLIAEGDAMESYEFFAYKGIDSAKVSKILSDRFGYQTDKVFDYLDLLRTGANYYDSENTNADLSSFEGHASSFLQKCDLDYQRLRQIWLRNGANLDRESESRAKGEALRHLDTIMSLELEKQGSSRKLLDTYGIENYGRYGAEVLQRQLDEESNITAPYGVIMYTKADFEGSGFRSTTSFRNDRKTLSSLQDDLIKEGHLLRIVETGSKTSMLHRVLGLRKRYEATAGKIKFGALAAHGSELDMTLSDKKMFGNKNGVVYIEDLYKLTYPKSETEIRDASAFEEFKSSFDEGVDFVLLSCSTAGGDEDNVARAGSRATSFAVTGPEDDSRDTYVKVFKQNGKLRLSQHYSVPRRVYRGGNEEEIDEYAA